MKASKLRELIAKATPGPWAVYDDSNDGKTNRIEIVAMGKTIAHIYQSVPAVDLPNALLIFYLVNNAEAIAELIEAAELNVEAQDEPCRWDHDGYCQSHNLDHQLDGCRAAKLREALTKIKE